MWARRIVQGAVMSMAWLLTAPAAPVAADDYNLVLQGALWPAATPEQRKPLMLKLRRDGEGWQALVMGHARSYNWGDHYGFLETASQEGDVLRLSVKVRIEADPWSETSGSAEYAVELRPAREGDGLRGTWSGTFRGRAARGDAQAVRWASVPGFTPPKPGEHPRMLLRRANIPVLQKKARTDWGRPAMERLKSDDPSKSSMAVGRGLLYVLTGEKEYAVEARKLLEQDILDARWYWVPGPYHEPAVRAVEAAIAYDLIHETCDEAFRRRMAGLFVQQIPYYYRGADNPLFNPNDGSNWSAMFRSGLGMCALSLIGEAAPLPPKPEEPQILRAEAPKALRIGRGVPVVPLESGQLWSQWLFAGPLKVMPPRDGLEPLGGAGAARPEEGTRIKQPEDTWMAPAEPAEVVFAPLPAKGVISRKRAELIRQPKWAGGVDVTAAMGVAGPGTCYLYSVVQNAAPGLYRIEMLTKKMIAPSVVIAGRRLRDGDIVHLEKGRLPVLAWLPVASKAGGFTNVEFYLKLHAVREQEAQSWLADRMQRYAVDLALWDEARKRREAGHLANPLAERWLGVGRQRIENWAVRALGEIGWNHEGEAYTQHSYRVVLPFAHAYRNVTGHELVSPGKLNTCLLNYVGRTIVGTAAGRMQSFAPGGGPLGVDNWARGLGLLLPEYRAHALWTWDHTQSLADAGKLKLPEAPVDHLDPMSAAFRFVNYPLDVEERNPSVVRERICTDTDRGGYVFRNRWRDDDDIVATVFLNSNFRGGGWSSAETGEFRISGLGVDWAVRGMGFGNGSSHRKVPNMRAAQNVLLPAELVGQGVYEAVPTHCKATPDGGGLVSFNLNDVYTAAKAGAKGETRATPTRPGARAGYDVGIRGMRAFAADYSGACGAPALFAVADQVSGTSGVNTWQLVTEQDHAVTIADNTFTVKAANGATLHATVVSPKAPKVETDNKTLRHEINYHGGHRRADFRRTVVNVRGAEFFLVVMTLQKGKAPEVRLAGEGRGAAAEIGRRKVRFVDGQLAVE